MKYVPTINPFYAASAKNGRSLGRLTPLRDGDVD
jgi:hypothetical protein